MKILPCGRCRLCCSADATKRMVDARAVRLLPEEVDRLKTVKWQGRPALALKPNGECWYLTPDGCSIQDHKPWKCAEFSCVEIARAMTKAEAKRYAALHGQIFMRVYLRGRQLLQRERLLSKEKVGKLFKETK